MSDFYPGQRWLSETEIEFGIGTILAVEDRRVTVLYRATMETRVYATHSAPLTRVQFSIGDEIRANDGTTFIISRIEKDEHKLFTYHGTDLEGQEHALPEVHIDHHLAIHDPTSRLLAGQIDDSRWFTLRLLARQYEGLIWQSPVRGLQGARMSLVPHQLYIADQLARQPASRGLLADEVGLGKTIEACLVLHRRIVQGQCDRALIIVPAALVNQWLVELLRRFTLSFSIFDEERCQDLEAEDGTNPFLQAQLVLCTLPLFEQPGRLQQALEAGWDMLIVDEAHHLHWTPESSGDDYLTVETLSEVIDSVLLLTATPEQLGRESHFARLRLLDPERFHDLGQFIAEEEAFEPVANLAEEILETKQPDNKLIDTLKSYGIETSIEQIKQDPQTIARQLIDLYGTSRLLFRNTRKYIQGFPQRNLIEHPLPSGHASYPDFSNAVYDSLLDDDPRIEWLLKTIRELRPEKLLLICSEAKTTLQLEELLLRKEGIRCAAFHEGLSIIQRDRAAAWFAEEGGAEILLCSEIGSEGRNFQFAHHLILFDLPLNPDLLEQRIGRLDRIGQREQVNIHVPYIKDSAQQVLLNWYQRVSHIFTAPDPVAVSTFEAQQDELLNMLHSENPDSASNIIDRGIEIARHLTQNLQQGRERLLSLSSFDETAASAIIHHIQRLDAEYNLPPFMEQVFDLFGLDSEEHSDNRQVVRPGDHMIGGHFPHVQEDGTLITFQRETALVHEDTQFLTWDHPMVTGAIDMVTSGEFGNSGLSVIHHDKLPAGTSLLELLYRIDCPSPAHLPTRKYIKQATVRLLLNTEGKNLASHFPHESLTDIAMQIDRQVASQAIKAQADQINELISDSRQMAESRLQTIIENASQVLGMEMQEEIQRLTVLKKHNPNISDADIEQLHESHKEINHLLSMSSIKLDAIRLIVVSD
ncbi:MAG: RNA polymerase-associated protein RapA [Gammaproteobacteria bacterium]|nr:RNA polymerase-associated protein RapA [Gammaproteobacteria bacterium]